MISIREPSRRLLIQRAEPAASALQTRKELTAYPWLIFRFFLFWKVSYVPLTPVGRCWIISSLIQPGPEQQARILPDKGNVDRQSSGSPWYNSVAPYQGLHPNKLPSSLELTSTYGQRRASTSGGGKESGRCRHHGVPCAPRKPPSLPGKTGTLRWLTPHSVPLQPLGTAVR